MAPSATTAPVKAAAPAPKIGSEPLRPKEYFDKRSAEEMKKNLKIPERTLQEMMACACRIISSKQEDAGMTGQISARSDKGDGFYWTLRFGVGWDEANPEDMIEVDGDLNTVTGDGMANPATRFHLWVYSGRPDVHSIIHTHSPWVQALAAAEQPLVVSQMDMTPFYNNCAFLGKWPGLPIADDEGVIITAALADKNSIILANHGMLTAGKNVRASTYLAVLLERACRIQLRAAAYGPPRPVNGALAKEAGAYLLRDSIVNSSFEYWYRQSKGFAPMSI